MQRVRSQSPSELSRPRKKSKPIDQTLSKLSSGTTVTITTSKLDLIAPTKVCQVSTDPLLDQDTSQVVLSSPSTLASRASQGDLHSRTSCFNADALTFLSKLGMPLLVCGSSTDHFFRPCQTQLNIYQKLAISFILCRELFIKSVLAPRNRKEVADKRLCTHVIVIRLEGYQSFFAQVQALVATIEEQHTAGVFGPSQRLRAQTTRRV